MITTKLFLIRLHRDVTISLFDSSDLAPLVWHYPVGVLLDLVGHRGGESARLDVVVRFREAKVYGDNFIEPRSPELFGSLFLNQLKVALSVRGKGLSQLNILPKDETDILQSLAGGGNHVNLDAFFGVFDSIFSTPTKVAAVKLYLALEGQIHTRVASVAFEAETTVSQLVSNLGVEGSGLKIWTQGVCLHGETPVEFLQQHCVYADGFVHLVTVL